MPLKDLVKALKKPGADGAAVVDAIANDALLPGNEADYITKYFDSKVRQQVFAGSKINEGLVSLSIAAANLKSAFQQRYASQSDFPPFTAYHGTKQAHIPGLIVSGGFNPANETLFGSGVYFFHDRSRAEDYAKTGTGLVLEVTIFSDISVQNPAGLSADKLALQTTQTRNIFLVKNGLVIFPKAVYSPT